MPQLSQTNRKINYRTACIILLYLFSTLIPIHAGSIKTQTKLPNLYPIKNPSWDNYVIISNVSETTTSTDIYVGDTVYLDFSCINRGEAEVTNEYYIDVKTNDTLLARKVNNNIKPGYAFSYRDVACTFTEGGVYTIQLICDSANTVLESNENDNTHTQYLTVLDTPHEKRPNLIPYKSYYWDDYVVVSDIKDTTTHSEIFAGKVAYFDFGCINNGQTDITQQYFVDVLANGNRIIRKTSYGLPVRYAGPFYDAEYTFPDAGIYTIQVICDADNSIAEMYEDDDNVHSQDLTVSSLDLPNLVPFKKPEWDDFIMVANVKGTRADSTVYANETAYIDIYCANNGKVEVNDHFYIQLFINDNLFRAYGVNAAGLDYFILVEDIEYVFPKSGQTKLTLVLDPENVIHESNENDNTYVKYINVQDRQKPNLVHYKSNDWDDYIVVSDKPDTHTSTTVNVGETVYIDIAVGNNGELDIQTPFSMELWSNDTFIHSWTLQGLNSWHYMTFLDITYQFPKSGTYLLQVKLDPDNRIDEINETDNLFKKQFQVANHAKPNLRPFLPDGWEDIIIVSNRTGTRTNSPIYAGETAFIDFAYGNDGEKEIQTTFYSKLFINDILISEGYKLSLPRFMYVRATDLKFTFPKPGAYTIRLLMDSDYSIDESNENDNVIERTINVLAGGAPDIRIEPELIEFDFINQTGNRKSIHTKTSKVLTDRTIHFKRGDIQPHNKTKNTPLPNQKHMLMQFGHLPNPDERLRLKQEGITLLTYIPDNTYWVSITPTINRTRNTTRIAGGIHWAGLPPVDYKISMAVDQNEFHSNAIYDDGSVRVHALIFKDESIADATAQINRLHSDIKVIEQVSPHVLSIKTFAKDIYDIAVLDCVEWVEPASPPPAIMNAVASKRNKVDNVRNSLGLDGNGIIVGVWDGGQVFPHMDLKDRVVIKDQDANISNHATHVAGTIAGDGTGDPIALGMAPKAMIWSYYFGDVIEKMKEAHDNGALLSNHSWGLIEGWTRNGRSWEKWSNRFGVYSSSTSEYDQFIYDNNWIFIKSAGNDRQDGPDCSFGGARCDGPFQSVGSISCVKNGIVIGATEDNDQMTSFSSWGPTKDGRVKPDVCANGDFLNSTMPDNKYALYSGTSMAAPSVTGASALLYQHFKNFENATLSADLLKALLIHGATDLGRPGPDYEFGWGIINTESSALLISEKSWLAETIQSTGDQKEFQVYVPDDMQEFRVTIVWNDPAGSPSATKALVNDLDMQIISPKTDTYYPWVLDKNSEMKNAQKGINHVDNVEQVIVSQPMSGKWRILVSGFAVPQGPQRFVLIAKGLSRANQNFTIYNDGIDTLNITQMDKIAGFNWASIFPDAPISIPPGKHQTFTVGLHTELLDDNYHEGRFLVYSNDLNNSPYENGVYVKYGATSDNIQAVDDMGTTARNTAVDLYVTENDQTSDIVTLTIATLTQPQHGIAKISDDQTYITYTPDINYVGEDSFFYTLNNSLESQGKVTVVITINQPPNLSDDATETIKNKPVCIQVLDNDFDPENDTLTIAQVHKPTNGIAHMSADKTQITYQPAIDFTGTDSFVYEATDGINISQATVTIVVKTSDQTYQEYASADTPIVIPDNQPEGILSKINIGAAGSIAHLKVTLNISHEWCNDMIAYLMSPAGIRVTLFEHIKSKGQNFWETTLDDLAGKSIQEAAAPFTGEYIPDTPLSVYNETRIDGQWQLHIVDGGRGDTGTLNSWRLNILYQATNENRSPVANNDVATTGLSSFVSIDVLSNDYDLDKDQISIKTLTTPKHGTAYLSKRGDRVIYVPDDAYYGSEMFTYTIEDQAGAIGSANVNIEVLNGGDIITDGSFENGQSSNYWMNQSDLFDTNVYERADLAHSGDWLVWFEGGDAAETASVRQTIVIPQSANATLRFWMRDYLHLAHSQMYVKMDDQILMMVNNMNEVHKNWKEFVIDINEFSDAKSHVLSFEANIFSGVGPSSLLIDDVSLIVNANETKFLGYPSVSGDPTAPKWTIYLASARANNKDLKTGDEIAIYHDNTLVGTFKLSETLVSKKQFQNVMIVWQSLMDGPGYTPGNPFTFRCRDMMAKKEYRNASVIFTNVDDNSEYSYLGENGFPENNGIYSIIKLDFSDTLKGDMDKDGVISLMDAIIVLKTLSDLPVQTAIDTQIQLQQAIYILRVVGF